MNKGIFITFEGGEGCGKTSQINLLAKYFEDLSKICVITREPGGTPLSEKIRELLLHAKEGSKMSPRTELLLFEAARAQHVDELIKPSLEAGKVVISDRFMDSSTAYQGVARKLGDDSVKWLNDFAVNTTVPDLTIILDVPAQIGLERANKRDNNAPDRMGSEKISFYEDVRKSFLKLAATDTNRFVVVDASVSIEDTYKQIIKVVQSKFNG